MLVEGEKISFSVDKDDKDSIFVDYPNLCEDVKVGEKLYLANGDIQWSGSFHSSTLHQNSDATDFLQS